MPALRKKLKLKQYEAEREVNGKSVKRKNAKHPLLKNFDVTS